MDSSDFAHESNNLSSIFGTESIFSLNLSNVSEINCSSLSFDMPIIDMSESQFWENDKRLDKTFDYNRIDDENICLKSLSESIIDKCFEVIFNQRNLS